MSLTELLTLRSKKDLNECCCAGKQQIDVYRFGSVTTPCPWPAPPLPSLLLRLSLAFFWPSLIFALRSSRSLSRASLSSCAAKQNGHAFHFWVLAFKLFLGLNRATVLCVFVGSTVVLHTDAMAAISIFHPCRLRQTPCTMMAACSTA